MGLWSLFNEIIAKNFLSLVETNISRHIKLKSLEEDKIQRGLLGGTLSSNYQKSNTKKKLKATRKKQQQNPHYIVNPL